MSDPFATLPVTRTSSPIDWVPVTPSATPFTQSCRAIRADVAGTVTVTTYAGNSRVMNFASGETRLVLATAITAATATGLEIAI